MNRSQETQCRCTRTEKAVFRGGPASRPNPSRLPWVDALRGCAILVMIPANLFPYYAEPHPLWYRVLASCVAPPVFIAVSAGMVVLGSRKHTLGYYVQRGGWVVLISALIDLGLWGIFPFASMDVLYLIGLGMPVAFLCRNLRVGWLCLAGATVFAASYALQRRFGYHVEPLVIPFGELRLPEWARLLASWLVDGWFPVFPWLGFVFLGLGLFRMIFQRDSRHLGLHLLLCGVLLVTIGMVLLLAPIPGIHNFTDGTIMQSRGGYAEIFYPPTPPYLTAAVGAVCLTTSIFLVAKKHALFGLLAFFGRHALVIYILHQALGAWLIAPVTRLIGISKIESGFVFLMTTLAVILAMVPACKLVDSVKARHPPKCLFLQILFGR